ncbi:hypothetical protein MBLNU459_g1101t1 [Dothideomycetes sp. NU459]
MSAPPPLPPSHSPDKKPIPGSILIVGSGVFGLSTAYSLTQNPLYASTRITLVDRSTFPAADAASIDSSRIIRADYADIAYARLALRAQARWRNEWWGQDGIYEEKGLAVVVNADRAAGQAGEGDGNGELGRGYMRKSMENVQRLGLKPGRRAQGGDVEALASTEAIRGVFDTGVPAAAASVAAEDDGEGSRIGDFGYVNWRSGWADAEKGMKALYDRVVETKRVEFVHSTVRRLHFAPDRVTGVELAEGATLTADLVVLATGSWTPALLDLRGICSATGQPLCYVPLTAAESAQLSRNPTLLNESSGYFIITPAHGVLKVAQHGYGYSNPQPIRHPELPPSDSCDDEESITVSLPRTSTSHPGLAVPAAAQRGCRAFLAGVFPPPSPLAALAARPFSATRICWYADTASGDWLLDFHPAYRNLFVATGGSGHAYKFLPVVGDCVVDCLAGRVPEDFRGKWCWPKERGPVDHVWTDDWRGGVKGLVLDEELAKS